MNKIEKYVLTHGVDPEGAEYYYSCKKCGTMNLLNVARCPYCGKKRPRKAFEYAKKEPPAPSPMSCPVLPGARTVMSRPAVFLPGPDGFSGESFGRGVTEGLPSYYTTDEYGRVYKAKVSYGFLPCSAPVPIPTPSRAVQVAPVDVAFKHDKY